MTKSNDVKESKQVICELCDSEYKLTFTPNLTNGPPVFCPFCGSEHEDEDHEDVDLDADEDADEDY